MKANRTASQNGQPAAPKPTGATQDFVRSEGVEPLGDFFVLRVGNERRLFAELTADPDRPTVRPFDAYQQTLASIQPGWQLRVLQLFWPDPLPRAEFLDHVQQWPQAAGEGQALLMEGLMLSAQHAALPFARRTVLEFFHLSTESLAWWQGLQGLLLPFGVQLAYLGEAEITSLARWLFNPGFE